MNRSVLLVCLIGLCCLGCDRTKVKVETRAQPEVSSQMTEDGLTKLSWLNPPKNYQVNDGVLEIEVAKGTDFFNNPEDSTIVGTAPFLYQQASGDFVATAVVQPDFSSQWNAVALLLYLDPENWIKFAFESSDATGPSIVSVVTKGTSDDANGAVLDEHQTIWLTIARKGNNYAMHWSADGQNYSMARLTAMPVSPVVKIGIEAQSPVGEKALHKIHDFTIESKTVKDLRNFNH